MSLPFRGDSHNTVVNHIRKPNIVKFLRRKDVSHSLKGFLAGLVVIAIAILNLSLFFGLYQHSETEVRAMLKRIVELTFSNVLKMLS